jgi:hypothetical protein
MADYKPAALNETIVPTTLERDVLGEAVAKGNAAKAAAVASTIAPEDDTPVNVLNPNGEVWNFPRSQVPKLLAKGWSVESPEQAAVREYVEENKGLSGVAKVALDSFANEATFGVLGAIDEASETDPLEAAKRDALRKHYRVAQVLGGVGGFALSTLYGGEFFGGASKLGKGAEAAVLGAKAIESAGTKVAAKAAGEAAIGAAVGEAVAKYAPAASKEAVAALGPSFARKLLAKGAGSAVEGAALVSPRAITEAALGDPKKAAETLAYGMGGGAIVGLLSSSASGLKDIAVGGLEKSAGKLAKFVNAEAVNSQHPILKFAKQFAKVDKQAAVEGVEGSGAILRKNGLLGGELGVDPTEYAEKVASAWNAKGAEYGALIDEAVAKGAPSTNGVALGEELRAKVLPELQGVVGSEADTLTRRAEGFIESIESHVGAGKPGKAFTEAQRVNALENHITFGEAGPFTPEGEVPHLFNAPLTAEEAAGLRAEVRELSPKDLWKIRRDIDKQINWKDVSQLDYNGVKADIREAISDVMERNIAAADPELLAKLNAAGREYRVLSIAKDAAEYNVARGTANRRHSLTDYMADIVGGHIGNIVGAATGTVLGGPLGTVIGTIAGGQLNGMMRVSGSSLLVKGGEALLGIEAAMKKSAKALDAVPDMIEKGRVVGYLESIDRSSGPEGGALIGAGHALRAFMDDDENDPRKFAVMAERLTELAANPAKIQARLAEMTAPIAEAAPKVAAAYTFAAANVLSHLVAKLPKKPETTLFGPSHDWTPSDASIYDFKRTVGNAVDPFSIVQRIGDRTLSASDIETVQTLFPSLFAEMKKRVVQHYMSGEASPLDLGRRTKLAVFLGGPADPAMANIDMFQKAYIPKPKPRKGGADNGVHGMLKPPNLTTEAQKLTSR